ncbi:terpenoid synthase [Rickenella mellea]|uniref:Terpene synthase n=1 Tax=Rickenella mellea TaxID=50990 RepID=A0A4Y7Q3V6_9AGAM|nr:terpenoid synthase [Rickenella mellea]
MTATQDTPTLWTGFQVQADAQASAQAKAKAPAQAPAQPQVQNQPQPQSKLQNQNQAQAQDKTPTTQTQTQSQAQDPAGYVIPDLFRSYTFPHRYHPHGAAIADASLVWLASHAHHVSGTSRGHAGSGSAGSAGRGSGGGERLLSPSTHSHLYTTNYGLLAAHAFPTCPLSRLRVIADYMNVFYHMDVITDGAMTRGKDERRDVDGVAGCVMNALWFPEGYRPMHVDGKVVSEEESVLGKLTRDFWTRCIHDAGHGVQARFKEHMAEFFDAYNQLQEESDDDDNTETFTDLEELVELRRDTSGCKMLFDLVEYAVGVELPEVVVDDAVIMAMKENANDLMTWSSDIFSYSIDHARGDKHNLVAALLDQMNPYGFTLQDAINHVGDMCRETAQAFKDNKKKVPWFGVPNLDRAVSEYVEGLQYLVSAFLHWSFRSERYFGVHGEEVKRTRWVRMLPKVPIRRKDGKRVCESRACESVVKGPCAQWKPAINIDRVLK